LLWNFIMSAFRLLAQFTLIIAASTAGLRAADAPPESNARVVEALNATEWIYELDSARIDATIRSTRPPETVELNKKKFVKELRDIGAEIPDEIPEEVVREHAELQLSDVATLQLSWDRQRLAHRFDSPHCLLDIVIWDGLQGRVQQKWGTRQNGFSLHPEPPGTVSHFFSWLPWAMTAGHYAPLQVDADAIQQLNEQRAVQRLPEAQLQFHSVVMFAGTECELYARPEIGSWDRFYVEKSTGRLRGMKIGSWGAAFSLVAFPYTQKVLAERGVKVATSEEAEAAASEMPAGEQESLWREVHSRLEIPYWNQVPEIDAIWTVTLDDWREVEPEHWFPFRQVHFSHAGGTVAPQAEQTRITTVDRFDVNQPLEDELFALKIDEGADVYDATSNPPLRYKQDSHRTPEEWTALIAEARESQAENAAEQLSLDDLIGTPAPELPATDWLNSEPLTWESLHGRYVILEFWHVGCGPCWNYIGWMSALHASRDTADGVTVIGVHGAGADPDKVTDELSRRMKGDTSFPICIDQPLDEGVETDAYPSVLFSQLRVRRMPYAWLVGPDGKLIAHGDLPTLHEQALSRMRAAENQ